MSEGHAPLPGVTISEILGLIELLKSKGGREDIYKLAAELQMEYGDTLNVIRGAELLSFVNTPGGDVVLEKLGEKVSKAKINDKKDIVRLQMLKIPVFKKIRELLEQSENKEAPRAIVLERLAELIPNEDVEQSISTILQWARYAELFGYNDDTQIFHIPTEDSA